MTMIVTITIMSLNIVVIIVITITIIIIIIISVIYTTGLCIYPTVNCSCEYNLCRLLYSFSGVGHVNIQQIRTMASESDFALIRPSARQIGQLYYKVVRFTCEAGKPTFTLPMERFIAINICYGHIMLISGAFDE